MMKIVALIWCFLLAYAMADVSHLSKIYLPAKDSNLNEPLSDEPNEQILNPAKEEKDEAVAAQPNTASKQEAFLQAQPKQAQSITETQISTTYFPCPPALYPCSQNSGIAPGQHSGPGTFLTQGQYSGQGPFPGQGQFVGQGVFPSQGQFFGQPQYPGQGSFMGQGPFIGQGQFQGGGFPGQGIYQGQSFYPGIGPAISSGQSFPIGQFGPNNVNSLGPQVFPVQPGQGGAFGASAGFAGRPSLFPGQNLLEAGANFLFGQNQVQGSNFYPRPSFGNSAGLTSPGFFTDNGESGEVGTEEANAERFSPISRSAIDTRYDVNGGYLYDKPKFIVTL